MKIYKLFFWVVIVLVLMSVIVCGITPPDLQQMDYRIGLLNYSPLCPVHMEEIIITTVSKDYGFYGYGGAKTPFETSIEPTEDEIKLGLRSAYKDIEKTKYKIQVTHNPPHGTKIDMIQSGVHVGSNAVRSFIEDHQPILAVSAHIHEARGTDKLKGSFLINSGRFPEGYLGLVNIDGGSVNGKVLNITE